MHVQGRTVEIQNQTQWNLISRSTTAPSPLSSPTSILPPPALSFPQGKILDALKKIII
jgi:hypothetical protein